jgi:hypothetical protein
MNNISGFLQKFLSLEKDNNTKLSIIMDVLKQKTNLDLSKEAVEIKGDSLKIKCNPVMRSEIFMHRDDIESALKAQKVFLKIV